MCFGLKKYLLLIIVIAVLAIFINNKLFVIPTVPLNENEYWGPNDIPEHEDGTIHNFKINISEEVGIIFF